MKRNFIKTLVLLTMIAGVFFTACEDDFTEKDALDAQQTIDVSIYVYDAVSDSSITNAAVKMIAGGTEITVQTNEMGIAYFPKIKIASNVLISVTKEDFTKVSTSINISPDNYRQSQYTANIPLYSLSKNTAIIKGKLKIETDLTNDETEYVTEGTQIYAYLNFNNFSKGLVPIGASSSLSIEFVTTVDANGEYEFILPADNNGVSYQLKYPTFELNQTIAKNGDKGDPDFPEIFPTVVEINTLFNPVGSAISIPTVPSVYAYISNSVVHTDAAIISGVNVDSNGEVTGVNFSDNGSGYTADSVDVNIVSLVGGSGAAIRIGVSGGSLYDWNDRIVSAGSGYPTFSHANQVSSASPSFTTSVSNLKSGEIRVLNGSYGTGILRDEEIQ